VSDRAVRYGMIVLDAAPAILRARGAPVYFVSPEETIEYARLHEILRWIVFGDPDGWWPLYTQAGPVNPAPEPKRRVDISLRSRQTSTTSVAPSTSLLSSPSFRLGPASVTDVEFRTQQVVIAWRG